MSKIKTTATASLKQLTADEFMAKHQTELAEDDLLQVVSPPLSKMTGGPLLTPLDPEVSAYFKALSNSNEFQLFVELAQWWRIRLLKAAKKENSPEAYRELLESLLIRLGVEAPEGVFIPRRKSRGAPLKQSTEQTYRIWLGNDKPSWSVLAHLTFGRDYTKADAMQRKKLRDVCRRAVGRQEERLATKFQRD